MRKNREYKATTGDLFNNKSDERIATSPKPPDSSGSWKLVHTLIWADPRIPWNPDVIWYWELEE
jgi:hypothetical protein